MEDNSNTGTFTETPICIHCGKPKYIVGGTTAEVELCPGNHIEDLQPFMVGWLCPKCGGGMSPFSTRCPCVPFVPFFPYGGWEITCTASLQS